MLVVFFCVMMKILEFSSGKVMDRNNNRNNKRHFNNRNKVQNRRRHLENGTQSNVVHRGMSEEIRTGIANSSESDCNSNHRNLSVADSYVSNASSQDVDFIQDNSDYQWFLDYGYRDGSSATHQLLHQHTSVLSSLSASYPCNDLSYYDDMAKNLDANLAEVDMEDFRTEDIHSILTTLPTMCCGELQTEREGEMFASVSGSMMAKFDFDSSISPRTSSQDGDSTDTMSICKSELLFSPVKECPLPSTNFSVDSLDCDLLSEHDIMLTCQANKDNYTIAFEGSMTLYSDSDYHDTGESEATTSDSNNWLSHRLIQPSSRKSRSGTHALDNSMARSDSVFTTWSKLKKRSSEIQLTRHPSGNNNTTYSEGTIPNFQPVDATALKSQSMPNLFRQHRRCLLASLSSAMSSSVESELFSRASGCVKLFDVQNHHNSSSLLVSLDGASSCSGGGDARKQPNFSLVKLFMKQKSVSNEGGFYTMDQSSTSECWPASNNSQSEGESDSYNQESMRQRVYQTNNNVVHKQEDACECVNSYHDNGNGTINVNEVKTKIINAVIGTTNNWIRRDAGATECFEDSLVELSRKEEYLNKQHELIEEEEEHDSEQSESVEQLSESVSKIEESSLDLVNSFTSDQPESLNSSQNNKPKFNISRKAFNVNNNNSMERDDLESRNLIHRSVQTSARFELVDSGNGASLLKIILPKVTDKKTQSKDVKSPVYVFYPNYSLPDLQFLQEKQKNLDITQVFLMPQKFPSPESQTKEGGKTRRPFSCGDVEALRKKGFAHVRDWDSLTFLLPQEYRQILTEVPEIVHYMKGKEEIPCPLFCTSPLSGKASRCNCTSVEGKPQRGTNVSISSSTATQPSSGYRGSSTILSDSSSNQNHPNSNPLFVYHYDSTSSESAFPAVPKRRTEETESSLPPRPPLPRSILRKSLETNHNRRGHQYNCKAHKNNANNKRYSMFEMGAGLDMSRDEGVDTSVEDGLHGLQVRPPTPPIPKTPDDPGHNVLHLEDFLQMSGVSGSSPTEWNKSDMTKLKHKVSNFLSNTTQESSAAGTKKTVSFAAHPCKVAVPIREEAESSSDEVPSVVMMIPRDNLGSPPDMAHKRALMADVADAVEQMICHFTAAESQAHCIVLGDSKQTPVCAQLALTKLCPALYAVLSDGLRPALETAFGSIQNSVWQVVEASAQQGPITKALNDLVVKLNGEAVLTEGLMKFNAFVFGLLNVHSLDAWVGYLRTRESVLHRHYNPESLLLLANTAGGSVRALVDQLIVTLQPLALLPFKLDLLFEMRQLHHSLRHMSSFVQPDITEQQPAMSTSGGKPWRLMKLVRSIQNSMSQTAEDEAHDIAHHPNCPAETSPLPDLVDSSSAWTGEEKQRPRSCIEHTQQGAGSFSLVTDIASTVKKRWSGIHLGSKLFQAFDRLGNEDTEEEYTDSLEHKKPTKQHASSSSNTSSDATEPQATGGGKFKRLQMKWEMLSGKETPPPHQNTGTTVVRSRIPRLVTSPVRASELPSQTAKKPAVVPPAPTSSSHLRKPSVTNSKFKTNTPSNPKSEPVNASTLPSRISRPSSLPYKANAANKRGQRSDASSSLSRQSQVRQRFVQTLCHRLPSESGHLSFNEGEQLRVVLDVDEKWLLCCRSNQKGLVPKQAVIAMQERS